MAINKQNNENYYKRVFAKKCEYNGMEFDSQMEMHFAMFLDGQIVNYKGTKYYHKPVKYEREKYKFAIVPRQVYFNKAENEYEFLEDVIYTPDFYIPSLNKFIEIKGFSGDTPEWRLRKRLMLHTFPNSINYYTIYHHSDFYKFENHSENIIITAPQCDNIDREKLCTPNEFDCTGCIYMHAFPNGKVYIGQTTQNPTARWNNGNGYPKKYNPYLYNAIQKYGWNNIEHIILEDNVPKYNLNKLEEYYISKYNSCDIDFGYNLTRGGDNHMIDMISRMKREKPVICHETKTIYQSPIVVDKAFDISGVCNICNGTKSRNHYAKGYHWWYFDDYIKLSETEINDIINDNENYTKVLCITNNKTYNSIKEAASELGLLPSMICHSCDTGRSVGVKYIKKHYEYLVKQNKKVKKIFVIEDNLTFDTYKEMQKHYGVTINTIKRYEQDGYFRVLDKSVGYIFKRI